VEAVDRAQGQRLKMLYVAAEHEILFRQFPELFPSEATRLQLIGKEDEALFPVTPFNVLIEPVSPPEQAAKPEKAFRIVRPGRPRRGSVDAAGIQRAGAAEFIRRAEGSPEGSKGRF
jgi:hypothetical protein